MHSGERQLGLMLASLWYQTVQQWESESSMHKCIDQLNEAKLKLGLGVALGGYDQPSYFYQIQVGSIPVLSQPSWLIRIAFRDPLPPVWCVDYIKAIFGYLLMSIWFLVACVWQDDIFDDTWVKLDFIKAIFWYLLMSICYLVAGVLDREQLYPAE